MDVMIKGKLLRFIRNNIIKQDTEAVVNAANPSLLGGGGVDGAIHKAGGPLILEECKKIRLEIGRCEPGNAVITTGGNLKAKYVIHTVGPFWSGGNDNEPEALKNCYINSLKLANKHGIKSISFPSISTGSYGYPIEKASYIAINTVLNYMADTCIEEIRFVLFSNLDIEQYLKAFEKQR
jgi:O-acetyl-ADP-ribose deacetylase